MAPIIFTTTTTAMPRLPVELLARIFIQCLPDEPYIKPHADSPPLLFTTVCRQWREIALGTTELWCSLGAVQECWGLPPMSKARLEGYSAWLSRSGNRPLTLAAPFEWAMTRMWSPRWVRLLLSYRVRFERLKVVAERAVDLNELLDGANMLRLLEVHSQLLEGSEDLAITNPLPCLRTLLLDGCNASAATLSNAAWGNLTRLAIRAPADNRYLVEEFLDLVSRCPSLQHLALGPFVPKRDWPAGLQQLPPPPSHHPNLRSITVVLIDHPVFEPAVLILPALRYFRVLYEFGRDWGEILTQDVEGSTHLSPPQRFFQMDVRRKEDFYLFDVGWSNITHLQVRFLGDIDTFPTVVELCPNLQVLVMTGHRCSDRSTSFPTPLTYPSLQELSIAVAAPLGNILEMVTLPGLQSLTLEAGDCGEHGVVRDMLLRSRCALEKLDVWVTGLQSGGPRVYWTAEEKEELLESIPTLTELELIPCAY